MRLVERKYFFTLVLLVFGLFYFASKNLSLSNFLVKVVSATATPVPTQAPLVYWGAYIAGASGNPTYPADYGNAPYDMRSATLFETNAGKRISILHWGVAWKTSSGAFNGFPTTYVEQTRQRGTIPMINWGSWQLGQGVNQPAFKLTNITRGDFDSYITTWAQNAKAWGHPLFVRFDHEMNIGGQFSWNFSDTWTDPATGATYHNTAADYINMWKHVVNIFRAQGATNVTWVWCPNIYFRSGSNALPFMQAYPGDDYVDWNCVDGYNKSTSSTSTFSYIFTDSYNVMQQLVTGTDTACNSIVSSTKCNPRTKPIMIGEWASIEFGDDGTKKANWVRDALSTQLPNNFPGIKAAVWFNWNTANGLIIESTSIAQAAFKNSIAGGYYASNQFLNLPAGTIRALGAQTPTPTPTRSPSPSPTRSPSPSPSPVPSPSPTPRPGDINGDGIVNLLDYTLLSNAFGTSDPSCDLNHDGIVNLLDYTILSNNFGT